MFTCMCLVTSICICLPIYLPIYLLTCLPICLFIYINIYLLIYLLICLLIYLHLLLSSLSSLYTVHCLLISLSYQDRYRLVSVHTYCDFVVLPHLETSLSAHMTWYPTQSHYPDTWPTNPFPILLMPSIWLGSDKCKFQSHSFDSTQVRAREVRFRDRGAWMWSVNMDWSPRNIILTNHHIVLLIKI